jgi:hypothetical protein
MCGVARPRERVVRSPCPHTLMSSDPALDPVSDHAQSDESDHVTEDLEITTNWDECTPTFDSMDLNVDLLRGIYAYGFERPSAIQQVRFIFF